METTAWYLLFFACPGKHFATSTRKTHHCPREKGTDLKTQIKLVSTGQLLCRVRAEVRKLRCPEEQPAAAFCWVQPFARAHLSWDLAQQWFVTLLSPSGGQRILDGIGN